MNIIHQKGYAIEKDVDVVINSANGWLIQDSSGAGAIRERSDMLNQKEKELFEVLFSKLPANARALYEKKRKDHGRENKLANLSSIIKIYNNNKSPFSPGDALLDDLWSKTDKRRVIHAITMSYDAKLNERIHGTALSIQTSLEAAFRIVLSLDAKSVSLPIPCARPEYGLTPEESLQAIMKALEILKDTDITVIICHDNDYTRALLE
ncbi:MAG: hypothetical protein ACMXYK_05100 [Candidatus Woesearchaeota archaeon]